MRSNDAPDSLSHFSKDQCSAEYAVAPSAEELICRGLLLCRELLCSVHTLQRHFSAEAYSAETLLCEVHFVYNSLYCAEVLLCKVPEFHIPLQSKLDTHPKHKVT